MTSSIFWVNDIARSLREGFFMFWETLWPLILGFGLSGAVQAFVSHDAMQKKLGDHKAPAVARASFYGMVSSSCSYAASAMSKSLFVKGADFISANVFMFASTNLVVELGIVLIVLMGWQFAVSEFIGGFIMIVLFTMLASLWLHGRLVVEARERLASSDSHGHQHGPPENEALQHEPWRKRLRSKSGWADSATYTMADLTMLRKELAIGYVVAGFLATLVPVHFWNAVFLHGHGFWTSVENVIVGPFIAIISFVCSVGNVPLAAALWKGGISFGGVISFIFADLIALPLLLIYRRYYGGKLTLKMLAVFWLVMSAAGLITEGIFQVLGLVPTIRPTQIVPAHFSWNYTTYLNIVFLALFGLLYWTYRNRARFGAGEGYARDPEFGMQVEMANAPASVMHEGERVYFCSDRCRLRFEASPSASSTSGEWQSGPDAGADSVTSVSPGEGEMDHPSGHHHPKIEMDPVCQMDVIPEHAAAHRSYDGSTYYFCGVGCADEFDKDPSRYVVGLISEVRTTSRDY